MVSMSSLGMHMPCFLGVTVGGAVGAIVIGTNIPLAAAVAGSSYIVNHSISYIIGKSPVDGHVNPDGLDRRLYVYRLKAIGRIAFTILFAAATSFTLGAASSLKEFAVLSAAACFSYSLIYLITSAVRDGLRARKVIE